MKVQGISNQQVLQCKTRNNSQSFGNAYHFVTKGIDGNDLFKFTDKLTAYAKDTGKKVAFYIDLNSANFNKSIFPNKLEVSNNVYIACEKAANKDIMTEIIHFSRSLLGKKNISLMSKEIDVFADPKYKGIEANSKLIKTIFEAKA